MQTTATTTAKMAITDMTISTKISTEIGSPCSDCLLRNFRRLFDTFDIPALEQIDFLVEYGELMAHHNFSTTPEIQRELSHKFTAITGIADPYAIEKSESNRQAMELYNEWKPKVAKSDHPFEMALRLAIAGNIMDYGASNSFDIHQTIENVISASFAIDQSMLLKQRISQAKKILYLADNAGEIVFDKLFIETIGHPDLTIAVKGGAALNDATLDDARESGLEDVAHVISNGFDATSTILKECSDEFLSLYHAADLIISKGQGNLEGLIYENDARIFFLLMVKCDVMAEKLGVKKNSIVVLNRSLNA